MLEARRPDSPSGAEVVELTLESLPQPRDPVVARRDTPEIAGELDEAEIVVGIGKGVGSEENISRILPLVNLLGGSICATRDVTDAGWLPRQLQVGLTGRAIAPKLYFAIGIRGAFEHMVGVRRAGIVVAINKNAKAPVFKAADYGLVGDYAEIVGSLVPHLERRRAAAASGR
jgi:electron transfer flavoprotein alpha subunit